MNEKVKKTFCYIFMLTFGFIIGFWTSTKTVRTDFRADQNLRDYREQYEDCSARLEYCKSRVDAISAELANNEQSLSGVIASLRTIAERVAEMEVCLSDDSNDNDWNRSWSGNNLYAAPSEINNGSEE